MQAPVGEFRLSGQHMQTPVSILLLSWKLSGADILDVSTLDQVFAVLDQLAGR
jgi:hypothetical protein